MQPAYDPTSSYYTSAFRGQDADRLYPPYVPTNTSSKYSGNIGLMTAPSLPSSQEVRVGCVCFGGRARVWVGKVRRLRWSNDVGGWNAGSDCIFGRQCSTEFASGKQRAERTDDASASFADALHAAALGAVRWELRGVPVHAAELSIFAASVSAPHLQLEQQYVRSATSRDELPSDGRVDVS